MQLQFAEPYSHNVTVQNWQRTIFGEYCQLCRLGLSLLKHFDGFTSAGFLTIVDFPQIQDLPLDYPIALGTSVFHNAPIAMFFAVLEAGLDT